jgi:hypothetical protein
VSVLNSAGQIAGLSKRVSRLERLLSSFENPVRRAEGGIAVEERAVDNLRLEISRLKSQNDAQIEIESQEYGLEALRSEAQNLRTLLQGRGNLPRATEEPHPEVSPPLKLLLVLEPAKPVPLSRAAIVRSALLITPPIVPSAPVPVTAPAGVPFRGRDEKSMDGMISYLTRKHGGECSREGNCDNRFEVCSE